MGRRFIPALIELIEPSSDEMTFLDKLHKLEKFNLINSELWNVFRSIRNNLTHIYPEDKQETLDAISDAYEMVPQLEIVYLAMKHYADKIIADYFS